MPNRPPKPSTKSISALKSPRRWFSEYPEERRRVIVTIGTFVGHGTHVHVTLKEEDEPVFDADEEVWIIPANDEAGAGRERMMKFHERRRAEQWVKATFAAEFSPETHELVWADAPEGKWFYREGD